MKNTIKTTLRHLWKLRWNTIRYASFNGCRVLGRCPDCAEI